MLKETTTIFTPLYLLSFCVQFVRSFNKNYQQEQEISQRIAYILQICDYISLYYKLIFILNMNNICITYKIFLHKR